MHSGGAGAADFQEESWKTTQAGVAAAARVCSRTDVSYAASFSSSRRARLVRTLSKISFVLRILLSSPLATTVVRPQRPGIFSTESVPIQGGSTGSETEVRTLPLGSNPSSVRMPSMGAPAAQAWGRQAVGYCTGNRVLVRSYPAKTSGRRERKNRLASNIAATISEASFRNP